MHADSSTLVHAVEPTWTVETVDVAGLAMPLFAPSPGTEAYVPVRDPDYLWQPGARDLMVAMLTGEAAVFLTGPSGVGKTSLVEQYCALTHRPLISVSLTNGVKESHLIGQPWLEEDATGHRRLVFKYGLLPLAMRMGAMFRVDEFTFMPPQVAQLFQSVINPYERKLVIPETGETLLAAPGFMVVATDNTVGLGDETGLYAGTEVQNTSLFNRFTSVVRLHYLSPEQETEWLLRKVPTLERRIAEQMVHVANLLRQATEAGDIRVVMSLRQLLVWARRLEYYASPLDAARAVIINRADSESAQVVARTIELAFGEAA